MRRRVRRGCKASKEMVYDSGMAVNSGHTSPCEPCLISEFAARCARWFDLCANPKARICSTAFDAPFSELRKRRLANPLEHEPCHIYTCKLQRRHAQTHTHTRKAIKHISLNRTYSTGMGQKDNRSFIAFTLQGKFYV